MVIPPLGVVSALKVSRELSLLSTLARGARGSYV